MISSFILTVYAFLCGLSYFNINYATILLSQLIFFKDATRSKLEDNYTQIFLKLSHKCKMEMNKYMTITEHCKKSTKSF